MNRPPKVKEALNILSDSVIRQDQVKSVKELRKYINTLEKEVDGYAALYNANCRIIRAIENGHDLAMARAIMRNTAELDDDQFEEIITPSKAEQCTH